MCVDACPSDIIEITLNAKNKARSSLQELLRAKYLYLCWLVFLCLWSLAMSSQNIDPVSASNSSQSRKPKDGNTPCKKDSASVKKRLQQELMGLMMSSQKGISAFPEGDNLFLWVGTIEGAAGTVYENLKYRLTLEFSSSYPYEPPTVKFSTPCFHPNVDEYGNICLDILKEKWSALYEVRTILLSIQSLLAEPNNDSPLNVQAADMWASQTAYKKHLLHHYEKHAKPTL